MYRQDSQVCIKIDGFIYEMVDNTMELSEFLPRAGGLTFIIL